MQVTLVGLGCGSTGTMTLEGQAALMHADWLIGAKRLLESLSTDYLGARAEAVKPGEIAQILEEKHCGRPCVVYSGDTGFYSGTRGLLPLLEVRGIQARVLPGLSSVQVLSARLGRPWQDWKLASAHGTECDPVAAVSKGRAAFFLTGGALGPNALCARLTEAGLGDLAVTVAENLSYDTERIVTGTARAFACQSFAPLSVLLAEAAPKPRTAVTSGIADSAFLRGEVPMTKQEVRAAALGKLAITPRDTLWDVGAGTGSVSVELALAACDGRVYAVECNGEACGLITQNKARFGAWNLELVPGKAPEALADLPAPDAVFIGGTKGNLSDILDIVYQKNKNARICVSSVTIETLASAVAAFTARGVEACVSQISVSRTKAVHGLHMMAAQNPVFLITGGCED